MRDARFEFEGRQVWYGIVGEDGAGIPLVCVPGGPGMSHDYLQSLAEVAESGRPVVFYDALGSGRSDRPRPHDWTPRTGRDELEALIAHLALGRYHLFAHSAAGLTAYPHAFASPAGLAGLILSSCPPSIPELNASARRLLELSTDELDRFERAERNLIPRDARYMKIVDRYARTHLSRVRPSPAAFLHSLRTINDDAHRALKGGLVLYTTALEMLDVTPHLGEISAPTLVTSGQYDFLTPAMCEALGTQIPRCELEVFAGSSHMPHLEEPDVYAGRIVRFLDSLG